MFIDRDGDIFKHGALERGRGLPAALARRSAQQRARRSCPPAVQRRSCRWQQLARACLQGGLSRRQPP